MCHPELVSGSRNSQTERTPLTRIYKFASSLINSTLSRKGRGENAAFTLAEVLITLGIIGVVAALTLPTLIQNYKKREVVTKLKKTYSVMANAIKMSEVQNGDSDSWNIPGSASEYVTKYFLPYLNSAKICKTYQECGFKSSTPYSRLNGTAHNMIATRDDLRVPVILNDGTYVSIAVQSGGGADGLQIVPSTALIFDINGAKGPNTLGIDVFPFNLNDPEMNKKGLNPTCPVDELEEVDDCIPGGDGWYCSCSIVQNGWEIPDDYPVKF